MPTYEYACRDCGEHLEVVQSFKEDALTTCPACSGSLRKVFSAAGIIFKGSGWHVKDYASTGRSGGSSSETTETAKDGGGSDTGGSPSKDGGSTKGSDGSSGSGGSDKAKETAATSGKSSSEKRSSSNATGEQKKSA